MNDVPRCGWWLSWQTDTGLRTCAKPAKFRVLPKKTGECRATSNGLVCGVHRISAEYSWQHRTEPLAEETNP